MSANTVARRVQNIAENISSQLFDKNGHVEWFSLALDESTDVSDTAQVLIYIRGLDKSYEVHEELLYMYSIHGTTTGIDIFKGVEMAINKKNLRWKNLKCITTDGGKNMSGKDKGVVALVSKAVENDGGSKPLVLHCIIHQQSLCGKCLDTSDVLKPVISIVNFIRPFGLNHRQFRQFIAEIGETDLPYHTAVRWLSCGKVLQRFFELRAVIEIFLNEKHRPLTELQNNAWLWKLAFYVDLTKHVNELNLRLQGENQHLPDLYTNIKSFRMKLILFQSQLRISLSLSVAAEETRRAECGRAAVAAQQVEEREVLWCNVLLSTAVNVSTATLERSLSLDAKTWKQRQKPTSWMW
ncbi:general transcription factor II-I repeat domain-containing protein 2-like [Diabrotica virgifera virgifera]|uniref:General transcription factor II-I repeat domain-containing protein 2-like n=1 Tax=Diabrotica virgifera virgifera TaxID=50390 RepID=A0ABM5L118_DIAVI|nr:general transcription factor II-I repeat domain-containing protein 2-like [Diabrotica virgifera virgifera]